MEATWVGMRAHLRRELTLHPDWTYQQLADAVGCSKSMVGVWKRRFVHADPSDVMVLFSRPRRPRQVPSSFSPQVRERIVELRLAPPDGLGRTPGPRTLLYFLHRDPQLQGQRLPRSTRTIWRILRQEGLLSDAHKPERDPWPQREPLEEVQVDFKDCSSVPADPEGKRAHVVEVMNFVDVGTSQILSAQAHEDFHAQTALEAVVTFLRQYGLPSMLTFDRDPRWVGSPSGRDFPSAFSRFLLCLGILPNICPPRHPERNGYVERVRRLGANGIAG